jgi:hypothetical protein
MTRDYRGVPGWLDRCGGSRRLGAWVGLYLSGASWTDFEGRTERSSVEGLTGGPEAPEPASALRYLAHRVTSSQEQRRSPRWSEAVAISTSPQPHA